MAVLVSYAVTQPCLCESCTLADSGSASCGVLALCCVTTRIDVTVKLHELHQLHLVALVRACFLAQQPGLASCKTLEAVEADERCARTMRRHNSTVM